MRYESSSSFTSPPINVPFNIQEYYLTVTGTGTVYIDLLEEDGVFRTFPELTFIGTTAQVISVKGGQFRVRISATSTTIVEVNIK